jgi:hypothetical protein
MPVLLLLLPPVNVAESKDYSLVTPEGQYRSREDFIVMTGFHQTPWVYKDMYRRIDKANVLIIETYVPSSLGDDYILVDPKTTYVPYAYWQVNVVYQPKGGQSLSSVVDVLPKPVLIISDKPVNVREDKQIVVRSPVDVEKLKGWPNSIIDNALAPRSLMERRMYLLRPGTNRWLYRMCQEEEWERLPPEPVKPVDIEYPLSVDDYSQHVFLRVLKSYWLSWFVYPTFYVRNGYELITERKQWFNRYFSRFIGKDDIATFCRLWNTMVKETIPDNGTSYSMSTLTNWLLANSLSQDIISLIDEIPRYIKEENVRSISSNITSILLQRISPYQYRSLDGRIYWLRRDIVSDIDRENTPLIRSLRVDDDYITFAYVP